MHLLCVQLRVVSAHPLIFNRNKLIGQKGEANKCSNNATNIVFSSTYDTVRVAVERQTPTINQHARMHHSYCFRDVVRKHGWLAPWNFCCGDICSTEQTAIRRRVENAIPSRSFAMTMLLTGNAVRLSRTGRRTPVPEAVISSYTAAVEVEVARGQGVGQERGERCALWLVLSRENRVGGGESTVVVVVCKKLVIVGIL